jgi:outer membrane protein assembly factor BamB
MRRSLQVLVLALLACCIAGCGGPAKPKPTELAPVASLLAVKKVWTAQLGEVAFPLEVKVLGQDLYLASSSGTVSMLDAETGAVRWSTELGTRIAAGVGADGDKAAVVTTSGELVTLRQGKKLWQQKLGAVAMTSPLVAGGRVFVITPDRTLVAFDGETGKRLWQQQRGADTLVLDRAGVLFPVGDTLVAGLGGRLVGLNPLTGAQRWDIPIATGRGTNEVERLVDVVAGVSRVGSDVCVRAYFNAVACVDLASQRVSWSKAASGFTGLAGDDRFVFGTESDGRLISWRRADGERAWQSDAMRWRDLGTPLVLGNSLAVPDGAGFVHLLSKLDGAPLGRLSLDGSPLSASPVLAGKTLVVVTQKGGVFAFRPE